MITSPDRPHRPVDDDNVGRPSLQQLLPHALHRLREISLVRTVYFGCRMHSARVLVYPRVHLGTESGSRIDGSGLLHVGRRWNHCSFLPSQLNLFRDARVEVNGDFSLYTSFSVYVNPGARLRLGGGYANCSLTLSYFEQVSISSGAAIAENVTIRDSDDHVLSAARQPVTVPVVIGEHVWIGMNATVLKGVTIGDGTVIAARAVVTRDVPPAALAAGVPARVIRQNVEWH